jgi:peptidoglycan LD-endopeptidase LytH
MMQALLVLFLIAAGLPDPIMDWGRFVDSVRDQTIRKEEARKQFPAIFGELKEICRKYPFQRFSSWVFPLQGYGPRDIGAGGFRPGIRYGSSPVKGYDFYDGDRHGGHPAYDIFIHDRNQDALDDGTRKPVSVLAPADLLILSTNGHWEPQSKIRGGCYVWALDPLEDQIFYFAHLKDVQVQAGAFITAGSSIGAVGRTGTNAWPARSPTHLHFMVLVVKENTLVPLDYRGKF